MTPTHNTVAKRLCKWLPMSIEMREAVHEDETREFIETTSTATPVINLESPVPVIGDERTEVREPSNGDNERSRESEEEPDITEKTQEREPGDDGEPSMAEKLAFELPGAETAKALTALKGSVLTAFQSKQITAVESSNLLEKIADKRRSLNLD